LAAEWSARLQLLLGIGVAIGLIAATRLQPLNPDDLEPFRVYFYDLWWPPLLIWLSVCLIESGFAIIRISHKQTRAWTATFLITGLSLLALSQPALNDPSSQMLWIICLLLMMPANMSLASWLALKVFKLEALLPRLWMSRFLILISVSIGLLGGLLFCSPLWVKFTPFELILVSWLAQLLWLGWLGITLGYAGVRRLYLAWQAGTLKWTTLPKPTTGQSILLLDLIAIALSLAGLFYEVVRIGPGIAIITFFVAWTLLSELITDGVLNQLYQLLRRGELLAPESPVRRGWAAARTWLSNVVSRLSGWLKGLVSLNSVPVALVKTLVGIALLLANHFAIDYFAFIFLRQTTSSVATL
jgi:hypothetical protein